MSDMLPKPNTPDANNVLNYGWDSSAGPESCNYITPKIIEILNRLQSNHVADLGSGNGALCSAIKAEGHYVVGIEHDKGGVSVASKSHPDIGFYQLGVQDSPSSLLEKEGAFDAVVSTEVVEHLYSPHLLPIFASSILKPDGVLIISTPYHGYLKNLALSIFDQWDSHHTPLWHGGHIKFWSRKTLTKLLEANGFAVTAFYGVGRLPLLWKSMILVAQKV
tara:strand:+ start:7568 stop:8227 length:660 start_codon:yes stop_codon:yes gene_type:complete